MLVNALATSIPLKYNKRGVYNHSLSQSWPKNKSIKNTSPKTVIDFLKYEAWPGELLRGHVEFDNSIQDFLAINSIPHILIIRNPLDVLISLANWWERHNEIQVCAFLAYKQIDDLEDRLMFLLTGTLNEEQIWPNFIERYRAFLGWIKDEKTFLIRFEDLLLSPNKVTDDLANFLPMPLNKERFLLRLKNRHNKTYTKPEEKIFNSIPEKVMNEYLRLGGADLESEFGYSVNS